MANAICNVEQHDDGRITAELWTLDVPGVDNRIVGEIAFPNRKEYELARANGERRGWDVPEPIPAKTFGDLTNAELLTVAADDEFPGAAVTAQAVLANRQRLVCACQPISRNVHDCPIHGHLYDTAVV